ncbi:hypothetical protein SAMN04488057_104420 [Cyclobacterium lianum]|uniref:Uncharacterized protein n=1 Tax=Cyclobacterium lianum TaxID=388280 RepID=A0A1M7MR12_9BACT|nr:hypothetical protein SAMN04488057_104420 [Cyclobacterium lianum]
MFFAVETGFEDDESGEVYLTFILKSSSRDLVFYKHGYCDDGGCRHHENYIFLNAKNGMRMVFFCNIEVFVVPGLCLESNYYSFNYLFFCLDAKEPKNQDKKILPPANLPHPRFFVGPTLFA